MLSLAKVVSGAPPYQDFARDGVSFRGPGREVAPPDTLTAVRLGLTGPAHGGRGLQLRRGVELAVAEANANGGYRGLPYQVIFRPDDQSWSVAAAQVVHLVYEDQVWGLISSLDGARAHAAELVVAKLWAPVITPGATDLSIDYANVPWVFRLMPRDRAQADLLVQAAWQRGCRKLALVTEGTRDGRLAAERVVAAARDAGVNLYLHVELDPNDTRPALPRLAGSGADALLLWSTAQAAVPLMRDLRRAGMEVPVFVPSILVGPELAAHSRELGSVIGAAPFDLDADRPEVQRFRRSYRAATGQEATHVAAYGYDAARLLIAATADVGLNRVRICDWLLAAKIQGVTGRICFSSLGGNQQEPILVRLRQGRWRAL